MRIAITGASGLVGAALVRFWRDAGHDVVALVRRPNATSTTRTAHWDPTTGIVDPEALAGSQAVVHLAGENIAGHRWNMAHKDRVRSSRVLGTRTLAAAIAALPGSPPVFVCASATGFYGDRGDDILTEASPAGAGFLPDVCRAWEEAAEPAREQGARVVSVRTGIVLARDGGALAKMLLPFRLGLGGRFGNGRQWMSWITLEDLVLVFDRALHDDTMHGAVNAVAPAPVRNAEFTAALAWALHRPAFLHVPAVLLQLALGEMARPLLLASARVVPARLEAAGHRFRAAVLPEALQAVLQ